MLGHTLLNQCLPDSLKSLPQGQQTCLLRVRARQLARLAVRSLYAELALYPKPGLVSLRDQGSHTDMDAACFVRSLFSLRHYFKAMALAGGQGADFEKLKALGILAEMRMLTATKGVNTHRGAIFSVGILCAAAAYCLQHHETVTTVNWQRSIQSNWGRALLMHSVAAEMAQAGKGRSHGQSVAHKFAASGAREEAAAGFPSVFDIALPRLQRSLCEGRDIYRAQIDSFFSLMAYVSDTNLYHRGGVDGAAYARRAAQQFMIQGGTANPGWRHMAEQYHQQFIHRRLSPGGSADLLAATCFVHGCLQEFPMCSGVAGNA